MPRPLLLILRDLTAGSAKHRALAQGDNTLLIFKRILRATIRYYDDKEEGERIERGKKDRPSFGSLRITP